MKIRLITLFFTFIVCCSETLYAQSGTCGSNLTWNLTNGVLTISGSGNMYNYDNNGNYSPWYSNDNIISVVILDGVTSIGISAFHHCHNLTSITIPNSVTSIGEDAFCICESLVSVTIPSSLTSIGEYAFFGCSNLSTIVWNARHCNDMKRSYSPFIKEYSITSFLFGEDVEYIPAYLCADLQGLSSVEIPNSVTSIGDNAFLGCSGLTSIDIPNSVTEVGEKAFYTSGESALKSLTIGSGVEYIEKLAFAGHKKLKTITCKAAVPPLCSENCFKDINVSIPLYVPAASISQYQLAPEWKEFYNVQAISDDAIEIVLSKKSYGLKNIRNGQLFIKHNGQLFNAQGARVE